MKKPSFWPVSFNFYNWELKNEIKKNIKAGKLEKDIGISIVVSCCLESMLKNQKEKDIIKKSK